MRLRVAPSKPRTPAEVHRKLQKERKSKTGKLEAKAKNLIAIADTREQKPFCLTPLPTVTETLRTGDYTLKGYEHLIRVERKSTSDLVGCMGKGRERFEYELERLRAFPHRIVVVEGSWVEVATGQYMGKLNIQSAMGTIASWQLETPFFFCGHRTAAELFTVRWLIKASEQPCPTCGRMG